jgi:hypothetical protein
MVSRFIQKREMRISRIGFALAWLVGSRPGNWRSNGTSKFYGGNNMVNNPDTTPGTAEAVSEELGKVRKQRDFLLSTIREIAAMGSGPGGRDYARAVLSHIEQT